MARIDLSSAHIDAVNKNRQTIINYDIGASYPPFVVPGIGIDELIEYSFSFLDTGEHTVTSVWICFFDSDEAPYPSKILRPKRLKKYRQWLNEGIDIIRAYVKASQERGYETFLSYRVDGGMEFDTIPFFLKGRAEEIGIDLSDQIIGDPWELTPWKKDHPEWIIPSVVHREQGQTFKNNFAIPEVRDYKLGIVKELAENYDLDGIELDFCRTNPFLPVDHQWENHASLTEWVTAVRKLTLNIEKTRGRPFLLAARVPDNVLGARIDGMDLERWAQDELLDIFHPGPRSLEIDFDGFKRITNGTGAKLYPCLDAHHSSDAYQNPSIEILRGVAQSWWVQGADGIETFNFGNVTKKAAKKLASRHYPVKSKNDDDVSNANESIDGVQDGSTERNLYSEIGNLEGLRYLNKTFVIQRRGGGIDNTDQTPNPDNWYSPTWGYANMNTFSQLPAVVDNNGRTDTLFTMFIGDDVDEHRSLIKDICLRVLVSDPAAENLQYSDRLKRVIVREVGTKLGPSWNMPPIKGIEKDTEVRINGTLLVTGVVKSGWLNFKVSINQVAFGKNLIGIRVRNRPHDVSSELKIEKIELDVNYVPHGHGE